MENQSPPAKGGDEEIAASLAEEDRISLLPQHILHHHILPLLPQIDAIRTCVLSKSWRFLGSTLPKFEFRRSFRDGEKLKLLPGTVLETTFEIWEHQDSESIPILKKWIPTVLLNLGVKKLSLMFWKNHFRFPLPSVIFQAEFLEELHLVGCELNQIDNNCIIFKLPLLKRVELRNVYIEDETFEKMMSSCPLIQHLVLDECKGLSAIKVNKARNLKHFDCYVKTRRDDRISSIEIDNDAPFLETIRIHNCENWYYNRHSYFPRLKSLHLDGVCLPTELLNNLSSKNCPCLEQLELVGVCSGFTEFKLSNSSIKRLIFSSPDSPFKGHIDAANLLYFEYEGSCIPSISFAATSGECKSRVEVGFLAFMHPGDENVSSKWNKKLYEFLKALSQFQISLDTYDIPPLENQDTCGGGELVVVEHLCLKGSYFESDELRASLNCLFRICRPRYIGLSEYAEDNQIESLLKILFNKKMKRQWQQDLEEISIEVSDKNTKEWHPIQERALSNKQDIRFRLKWRDFS